MLKTERTRERHHHEHDADDALSRRRPPKFTEQQVKDQLRRAEILFLRGHNSHSYEEALRISNEILTSEIGPQQRSSTGEDDQTPATTMIQLTTPLHLPPTTNSRSTTKDSVLFHIRIDNHTSATDEAAAIVLQSIFELSRQDDDSQSTRRIRHLKSHQSTSMKDLMPFLEFYRISKMPLELFVIFVRFWDIWPCGGTKLKQKQNTAEAIKWSVEVLQQCFVHENTPRMDHELQSHVHEIFVNLVTRFLPQISDTTVASSILNGIFPATIEGDRGDASFASNLDIKSLTKLVTSKEGVPRHQAATLMKLQDVLQEIPIKLSDDSWNLTEATNKSHQILQRKATEMDKGQVPIASPLKKKKNTKEEESIAPLESISDDSGRLRSEPSSIMFPFLPTALQHIGIVQKCARNIQYLTKLVTEADGRVTGIVALTSISIVTLLLKVRRQRVRRGALSLGTLLLLRKPLQELVRAAIKASRKDK